LAYEPRTSLPSYNSKRKTKGLLFLVYSFRREENQNEPHTHHPLNLKYNLPISFSRDFFLFLHLLVLSAAEATQLPVGVDVAILDETRQGEPELVVGDKLQTVGVLSELVVGNTTDKIQNKQRQQAVWEKIMC